VKQVYRGAELERFVGHIAFVADSVPRSEVADDGLVTEETINCLCDGSHLLTFWKKDKVVAQIGFLHGSRLRSELLQDGQDAVLTAPAQAWIQAETDWASDVSKMELHRKRKEPNQLPEPTPDGVAHR
jgi:hypothetical protein